MDDTNNNSWRQAAEGLKSSNYMIIKEKTSYRDSSVTSRHVRHWVRALLGGTLLAVGLSGPLRADPADSQSGDVGSDMNLDFSATAPLTLSISRIITVAGSMATDAHREPSEFDTDSDVVSIDIADTMPGYDLNTHAKLTLESGTTSRLMLGSSESVALGAPSVTMTAVTQSDANKLTKSTGAAPSGSIDNGLQGKERLRGEATGFSYAITLAVFALLGLVSVARRDINKLKS